jgi:hypothetical protein
VNDAAAPFRLLAALSQEPQHASSGGLPAGKQASADATQVTLLCLDPLPDIFGLLFALRQVRFDLSRMAEIVGDDSVHVWQGQRGATL